MSRTSAVITPRLLWFLLNHNSIPAVVQVLSVEMPTTPYIMSVLVPAITVAWCRNRPQQLDPFCVLDVTICIVRWADGLCQANPNGARYLVISTIAAGVCILMIIVVVWK